MEWNFVAAGPVDAHLEVPCGRIDIHPESDGPVSVTLEPAKAGSRRGEELVEASEVSFDAGRLRVHVPSKTFKNAGVICTVTLPAGSGVTIASASADITCEGTVGDVRATVASSDLLLGAVEGELSFSAASGDLRCDSVTGRLKVKGASSSVSVGQVGGEVGIALASGDVDIEDAASAVKINAVSGGVSLGRVHEGDIRIRTTSGDVEVGVASGVGAFLDCHSVSGDLRCTLPVDEATTLDAELRILCNTVSGDVRVQPAAG